MRISDWSSDVCSSDLLALARLGVVLEELSHDRLGLLLDLLHEALVGLVGSTRVVLDQVGEGTGRDHRADLLLVSQYGFEFALIGGHGGLAHAMASLTSDAMSKSQARSEEHTSELQSLMRISYAVFCLKKTHHNK